MASNSAQIATVPYRPPLATGAASLGPTTTSTSPSSTEQVNYGTSTDQPGNTNIYLYYFIVPYLEAHVLSPPSWRYAYIFWIFVPVLLVVWTVSYQLKRYSNLKALRRATSLPHALSIRRLSTTTTEQRKWYSTQLTIGHLIAIISFTIVLLAVSLIGDDYISPTTCTWGGTCPVQVFKQGPPKSTFAPLSKKRKRAFIVDPILPKRSLDLDQARLARRSPNVLSPRATALSLNPGGWAPFNDPLLAAPNFDIARNMWTISSRFGLIAYAVIPLVVSIGLKSWPFNIFATPWLTHYGFDKTSVFHRWIGRLVWIWSTIHTITFSIQLSQDYNPYGRMILGDVWSYYRFNWGVVAYIALTITTCFSFNPLRTKYYEFFYVSHVVLTIVFLVGCVIHYEPLWAWATIGLVLWGAERGTRFIDWLWFNGFFENPGQFWRSRSAQALKQHSDSTDFADHSPTQTYVSRFSDVEGHSEKDKNAAVTGHRYPPLRSGNRGLEPGQSYNPLQSFNPPTRFPPKIRATSMDIPKGFAFIQVLPGQTLRLTLKMFKESKWSIGQYVLVTIPGVAWWQSHPYTIACSSLVSLAQDSVNGKEMVLLLRARQGFSKQFYDSTFSQRELERDRGVDREKLNGTLVRCQISRPMGSAGRINWKGFESVLIVCGGSGVSFGLSVLEELCYELWKRGVDRRNEAESENVRKTSDRRCKIQRVRFVWVMREYAHLSWAAPAISRCMRAVCQQDLEVSLYVSNQIPNPDRNHRSVNGRQRNYPQEETHRGLGNRDRPNDDDRSLLQPPKSSFMKEGDSMSTLYGSSRNSSISDVERYNSELEGEESTQQHSPLPHQRRADQSFENEETGEIEEFEITDFDGENVGQSECEKVVSAKLKRESKRRRRNTIKRQRQEQSVGRGLGLGSVERQEQMKEVLNEGSRGGEEFGEEVLVSSEKEKREAEEDRELETMMDLNSEERLKLKELSEIVKNGRPKLLKILKNEVGRSVGDVLVTCCGPDSLNGYMRKIVSREEILIRNNDLKKIDGKGGDDEVQSPDSRELDSYGGGVGCSISNNRKGKVIEIYSEDFEF